MISCSSSSSFWSVNVSSFSSSSLGSNENEMYGGKVEVDDVVIDLGDVEFWCSSLDANLSHTWLHVTVVWIGDGVVGLMVFE